MSLDKNWFTEQHSPTGSAFSLHIKTQLHKEKTPFQNIAIYETTEFGNLMTLDNFIMLTERDNFIYHEMMTHPVLFTHPKPCKVIIIGGGDCGTLREVLKHPKIEQVFQIEIDERVTRLSEQYFPKLCENNDDPRVTFYFEDGIKWVANAPSNHFDVIIVDSTDPLGPGEGLFTTDFYRNCQRILTKEGLLVQQSESPLLHLPLLQSMHESMREVGFKTTRTLQFPQCVYPSGWWTATLASMGDLMQFREDEADNKPFETDYYNTDIHIASFVLPQFLAKALPD
ncbi:polyamine aminopropyltransferase [Candidatus Parabeggiatoa sp. HSG14]|uniref:polyamine aminopropyltransferase n=1 Tax=Candidatus Parabeggiatoa sp. HSG14 TaxID=3055593 RepID=UPI0025A6C137|nr:polyamine aminopropyltransferase [Thiotrichales bacterium HSG14]